MSVRITNVPHSAILLIAANLIVLFGAVYFEWNVFTIMFLFWAETAVIGFYSIIKLIKIAGIASIALIPFFILHFGGFMAGHAIFIFGFFRPDAFSGGSFVSLDILREQVLLVWPMLGVLLVSHGYSFFKNYLGNKEYKGTDIGEQMFAPYKRIIIMHVTIIFGGFLTMLFQAPILSLVLLVALKTIADFIAHTKEHTQLQPEI